MSIARSIFVALIVIGSVIAGAPRLLDLARLTRDMARLRTFEERRERLFGPWYSQVKRLRAPPTVDFIMLKPAARDIAVLSAAELYPRDVRFFDGWEAWKQRKRAEFLHDPRAVNAPPGSKPGPARLVVVIEPPR